MSSPLLVHQQLTFENAHWRKFKQIQSVALASIQCFNTHLAPLKCPASSLFISNSADANDLHVIARSILKLCWKTKCFYMSQLSEFKTSKELEPGMDPLSNIWLSPLIECSLHLRAAQNSDKTSHFPARHSCVSNKMGNLSTAICLNRSVKQHIFIVQIRMQTSSFC